MTKEQRIRNLRLFRDCSRAEVEWIARVADEARIRRGRTIAHEGSVSREFVVLMDGYAVARDGGADVILGPGSFFGELGLLDGAPNTHTITSRTDATALVFEPRAFRSLVRRIPSVALMLLNEMADVMRDADQTELRLRAVS
jgi:CRP-like cAMP-binding protein